MTAKKKTPPKRAPKPSPTTRIHPLFPTRPCPSTVHVLRVAKDARGRFRTILIAPQIDPWSIADIEAMRGRFGPGRYRVQPMGISGGIDGASQDIDIPDENGAVPLVVGTDEAEPKAGEKGGDTDTTRALHEMYKAELASVNLNAKHMVESARADRKADLEMAVAMMQGGGASKGEDHFMGFLRDRVKTLEEEATKLRAENQTLREDKIRKSSSDDDFIKGTIKESLPQLLGFLNSKREKKEKRAEKTAESFKLPDPADLAAFLADGGEFTEKDLAVFGTLYRRGKLTDELADLLRPFLEPPARRAIDQGAGDGTASNAARADGPLGSGGSLDGPRTNGRSNGGPNLGASAGDPVQGGTAGATG